MQFRLNGEIREYDGDPQLPLLTYLRQHEGILSAKNGCAPQAACGACAVDLDGKAILSCVIPMEKVDGGTVTTIEGLGDYRQQVFANAFVEKGGVQCGFCIPGIVMRANALINADPQPSRQDVEQDLTLHLCRCTGYKKIVDAIEYAADAIHKEEEIAPPQGNGRIGSRQPKYEAQKLVLGQHHYVDDVSMEGLKYGALRFTEHPRARILGIDTSQAEALPGVLRVITAEDIPGERHVGLIVNDWPLMMATGETTRYVGDVLAAVVAESEEIARDAAARIQVEYEVLEPVTDPHEALKPDAPQVHEGGNLLSRTVTGRGDLQEAMDKSAHVARGVFQTQRIEHGYMEPEAALATPTPDGLHVLSQGQGIYDDRQQIARLLGLGKDDVRVSLVPNGGAFGGKEDLSVQGHAALAAHLLQAPVKFRLTRDESISMSPKRHPIWMDYAIGCDEKGRFTFVKVKFVGDTGAYASVGMKVLERSAGHATGAYHFPVTDVEALAVYTNNIPCGAMRGFGVNQAMFGLESLVDELCEKGGFDRWQFRYDNALVDGCMTATGQVIEGGAGIRETLLAVKDEFRKARYAGIACGLKNTGIGNGMPDESSAKISIVTPGRVVVDHGWTEMGQGVNTVALQVVCNETGLDPALVEVRVDTSAEQVSGMTTASRATSLVGNALIDACKQFNQDLQAHSLAELVGKEYTGKWVVDWTTKPGSMSEKVYTHYSYSYATQVVILDEERGFVEKVIAAHDGGKIFNPTLFEGQLEGSVHMGLGYALTEEMAMEKGRPVSTRLRKMGIMRAKEMPQVEVIGVEVPDPYGPYGAKGVGEIGLVPTAGAVANALYQFDGERRRQLPMRIPRRGLTKKQAGNGA